MARPWLPTPEPSPARGPGKEGSVSGIPAQREETTMSAPKSRKKEPQPKPPLPRTPPGPAPRPVGHPVFAQPQPTADPTTFRVTHPSDGPAYTKIDQLNKQHLIFP